MNAVTRAAMGDLKRKKTSLGIASCQFRLYLMHQYDRKSQCKGARVKLVSSKDAAALSQFQLDLWLTKGVLRYKNEAMKTLSCLRC